MSIIPVKKMTGKIEKELDRLEIKDKAIASIKKLELPPIKKVKSKDIDPIPDDVSDIPPEDLGRYYSM